MPIPDGEARRLFEKLATQLRERGAVTLVDQVIDEIAQGRQVVYKNVRRKQNEPALYRPENEESASDRSGKREYAETLEYSPTQRLDLLLEALERAIVDAGAIEAELVGKYGKIRFVPEQAEENLRTFDVGRLLQNREELQSMSVHIARLRALVGD